MGQIELSVAILEDDDSRQPDAEARSTVLANNLRLLEAEGFRSCKQQVPLRTLDSLLHSPELQSNHTLVQRIANGGIQFLKIDVEGFELDVLTGIDLMRWKPEVVIVEGSSKPVTKELRLSNYEEAVFDCVNTWFVPRGEDSKAAHVARPINPVFDGTWVSDRFFRMRNVSL